MLRLHIYLFIFSDFVVAIDLIVQSIKDILANEHSAHSSSSTNTDNQNVGGAGSQPPPLVKRGSDSKTARLHWVEELYCVSNHRPKNNNIFIYLDNKLKPEVYIFVPHNNIILTDVWGWLHLPQSEASDYQYKSYLF